MNQRKSIMNPTKKYIGLIAGAILLLASCGEDNDEPNQDNTTADVTIESSSIAANDSLELKTNIDGGSSKVWRTSAFTLAGSSSFTSCRLDDEMQFEADGTYMFNGGEQLCGAEDNQTFRQGTWELDFENNQVIFDKETSREVTADLIGSSEDELRLKGSYMMMEVRGIFIAN